MGEAAAILRALADLAPRGRERLDVTEGEFAWLGTDQWPLPSGPEEPPPRLFHERASDLARFDALHRSAPILRLGWVYLVGHLERDGVRRRLVVPLVERPVRLRQSWTSRSPTVEVLGPWDLSPLVTDAERAGQLEQGVTFGGGPVAMKGISEALLVRMPRLRSWIVDVAEAMGVPAVRIAIPEDPRRVDDAGTPVAVVGFGIHTAVDDTALDLASSLRAWASQDPTGTAFDAAWTGRGQVLPDPDPGPLPAVLPLTPAQEEVVRRSRTEPVTVVSGPPGTGKSHTAVAVALDAVHRGQSVLVATRSAEAADVVAGLLERVPGPDPILFGGGTRATRLARLLAEGLSRPSGGDAEARRRAAWARVAEGRAAVDRILADQLHWGRYQALVPEVPAHAAVAPAWFALDADLAEASDRLATARARAGGWAWRARRALRRAAEHAGAAPDVALDRLAAALDVAVLRRAARRSVPSVAEARWAELEAAEEQLRHTTGVALDAFVRQRVDRDHTRAVAALATALRAGRSQRRRHLRGVDGRWLTQALPLWVGTLGDIEELLPAEAGLFDLVVLDEASQIDQQVAAVALLRARRAVVVGDPHQLRFVSFVADADVTRAVAAAGLTHLADRLDVRRVSAFDLAAGVAPVTLLDEHFRGPPHLVGFSARRFYGGRLTFATRHPANERSDLIDIVTVDGARDADGVNRAEVDAVADLLAGRVEAAASGGPVPSIGVATPFRPHAEALLARIRETWEVEDIDRFRLRVGTVHAFQGDERDLVVLSLAVGPDGAGLRFLEDPNLFNVMVTRARQRLVVVTSCPEPPPGLLRDHLRWASGPPPAEPDGPPVGAPPWSAAVVEALRSGGVPVRAGYPVGRWRVDACVGEGPAALGVELAAHPDGPEAHRRRHLALRAQGWQLVDAFPARFDGDPVAAAVDLATRVGRSLGGGR